MKRSNFPALILLASVASCGQSGLTVADCTGTPVDTVLALEARDQVDLLFIVDDTRSMVEEQTSLVGEIPGLVQALTSGDSNRDGRPDFSPVHSLHLGVVSADMGTGASVIPTCSGGFGDDGILRATGTTCAGPHPSGIFEFTAPGDATAFASSFACVVATGTNGCGFRQTLEAGLKALSPASPTSWTRVGYVPPVFRGGTSGHGGPGGPNDGFLRPASVLAIMVVSNVDDCSSANDAIYGLDSPAFNGVDLNLRCHAFAGELQSPQRYADGLLGLRSSASMLVFHVLGGMPPSDDGMDPSVILGDPQMTETVDPSNPGLLIPACVSSGGRATPARRLITLAQQLAAAGASTSASSICASDYAPAFSRLVADIGARLGGSCLPRALPPSAACRLSLAPPASTSCAALGLATNASGECALDEITDPAQRGVAPGWFYDDDPTDPASQLVAGCSQRISLSRLTPVPSAEYRFHCCL